MLKALGCIMILASSTGIGFIYSDKFKKRTKQLKEMQRSIYQLQNEIVYTHVPLPEAIKNIAVKSVGPIKEVFEGVSELLFGNKVNSVHQAFHNVLHKKKDALNLKSEDINILLDLSKTLGESDIDGQKRIFQLALENIKGSIEDSEVLMVRNVRMFRYLGFSLGAIIVILLV